MLPLFILNGKVEKGKQRGKNLGFPTINFSLIQEVPEGIYISNIKITGKNYNALTFIGAAQTFGESMLQAETYVLDFEKDVYGQTVEVSLLKKIRGNKKFESIDQLVEQMKKDEVEARNYFNSLKNEI